MPNARGSTCATPFVQLKMVAPDVAAQALAQELGVPYVDLADMLPDDEVLDQVPKPTVKQHSILPLFIDEGMLLVACVATARSRARRRIAVAVQVADSPGARRSAGDQPGDRQVLRPGTRNERAAQATEKEEGRREEGGSGKSKKAETKPPSNPNNVAVRNRPKRSPTIGRSALSSSISASSWPPTSSTAFVLKPDALFDP